jgi:hypothetical protein
MMKLITVLFWSSMDGKKEKPLVFEKESKYATRI